MLLALLFSSFSSFILINVKDDILALGFLKMTESMQKHVKMGDWIFEVKMVRALKVDEYGKPYSAIANCNINGDSMYVDGLLTKEGEELSKDDFKTLLQFCQKLGLNRFSYHRYQNGQSMTKEINVKEVNFEEVDVKALSFEDAGVKAANVQGMSAIENDSTHFPQLQNMK